MEENAIKNSNCFETKKNSSCKVIGEDNDSKRIITDFKIKRNAFRRNTTGTLNNPNKIKNFNFRGTNSLVFEENYDMLSPGLLKLKKNKDKVYCRSQTVKTNFGGIQSYFRGNANTSNCKSIDPISNDLLADNSNNKEPNITQLRNSKKSVSRKSTSKKISVRSRPKSPKIELDQIITNKHNHNHIKNHNRKVAVRAKPYAGSENNLDNKNMTKNYNTNHLMKSQKTTNSLTISENMAN